MPTPTGTTKLLLTPVEVAESLGISRTTVYRLLESGHLPYIDAHVGFTRRVARRIRKNDLDEFIRDRTQEEEVA